jgi:cell division protein FtsB
VAVEMDMTLTLDDEVLIRRYLLGNVTDDEQRRVEERLLTDDLHFNHLCKSEADLIDEYVRGALEPDDRHRFERHFLNSADRRESVAFAGVLNACLSSRVSGASEKTVATVQSIAPVTRRSRSRSLDLRMAMPYLSLFIVAALASAVALLLIKTTELRKQIEQTHAERDALEQREASLQLQLNNLAKELERERVESSTRERELARRQRPIAGPVQGGVVSLALASGLSRDAESNVATVTLLPRTRKVRLSLRIGDPLFDQYIAEVQTLVASEPAFSTSRFKTVRTQTNLKPGTTDGRTVIITIPAGSLTRSDYLVRLSGVGADGDRKIVDTYFFKVTRK